MSFGETYEQKKRTHEPNTEDISKSKTRDFKKNQRAWQISIICNGNYINRELARANLPYSPNKVELYGLLRWHFLDAISILRPLICLNNDDYYCVYIYWYGSLVPNLLCMGSLYSLYVCFYVSNPPHILKAHHLPFSFVIYIYYWS